MNCTTFPQQDERTLADDGDALRFRSTCAFSQACQDDGMFRVDRRELEFVDQPRIEELASSILRG